MERENYMEQVQKISLYVYYKSGEWKTLRQIMEFNKGYFEHLCEEESKVESELLKLVPSLKSS